MLRTDWACLALLILSASSRADDPVPPAPPPERVEVHASARAILIPLPPTGDPPTFVAVPVSRLIDSASGRAFDAADEDLGFVPAEIRRTFRLESANVLLGEPILVEFRTEVGKDSRWSEVRGGNYRGALRDDKFLFALRHRDGTWVPDTFAAFDPGHFGGISGVIEVEPGQPEVQWQALQAWAALDRPGDYELFAFHWTSTPRQVGFRQAVTAAFTPAQRGRYAVRSDHTIFDTVLDQDATNVTVDLRLDPIEAPPKSPILDQIPAEALVRFPQVATATEFARLPLTVRAGTPAERAAMVERWAHLGEARVESTNWREGEQRMAHDEMARVGMALARQRDFLPEFAAKAADHRLSLFPEGFLEIGLALRGTPEATALLLSLETPDTIYSICRYLPADQVARVIPRMIDLLTTLKGGDRDTAAEFLRERTGQDFGITADDLGFRHLTPDEGRALQPRYRDWWDAHRATFRPLPARNP